jgi:fructoselysine 6-kinase
MTRLAAVGEIAEDWYLADDDRRPGGISLNFARAAAFAGAEVTLLSAVGDDEAGARLLRALESTALERCLRVLPGATACQRIRLAPDGERIFCGFDAGVLPSYELTSDELARLADFRAVALPFSPESARVMTQCLEARPAPIIADFSQETIDELPRWVETHAAALEIAFVGGSTDLEAPLAQLAKASGRLVVLTAGAAGAFAFSGGARHHQPSLARAVVDTTGCGDAFQAGFTVAYLASRSITAALHAGAELAARVAARRGAAPD